MLEPIKAFATEKLRQFSPELGHILKSVSAAIFLQEIINATAYFESTSHPKYGDGWVYYTIDRMHERVCLSRKEQDTAIKILKKFDLLEMCIFGVPAKRYFRVKEASLYALFNMKKDDKKDQEEKVHFCPNCDCPVCRGCLMPEKEEKQEKKELKKLLSDCPKGANWIDPKGQSGHIYKKNIRRIFTSDSVEYGLAEFFLSLILKMKPDFKKPTNLQTWAKHIDLMIREDNRNSDEIRRVMRWVVHDPFWSSNVLSTQKLRAKFDELQLKSRGAPISKAVSHREFAEKILKEYESQSYETKLTDVELIFIPLQGQQLPTHFKFNEHGFQDLVKNFLEKKRFRKRE